MQCVRSCHEKTFLADMFSSSGHPVAGEAMKPLSVEVHEGCAPLNLCHDDGRLRCVFLKKENMY